MIKQPSHKLQWAKHGIGLAPQYDFVEAEPSTPSPGATIAGRTGRLTPNSPISLRKAYSSPSLTPESPTTWQRRQRIRPKKRPVQESRLSDNSSAAVNSDCAAIGGADAGARS